jgi:hypothetical protein
MLYLYLVWLLFRQGTETVFLKQKSYTSSKPFTS